MSLHSRYRVLALLTVRFGWVLFLLFSLTVSAQQNKDLPDSIKKGLEEGKYQWQTIDQSAQFPGGIPAFYQFVSKEMKFPKSAAKKGLKGRVYVQFVVNKDGTIDDASVRVMPREEIAQIGSMPMDILSDPDCEAEAMRVIRESPKWEPAQYKGQPVMQQMAVPILFKK
jgi:Gram-negative bacterial TonB protein C-terminal